MLALPLAASELLPVFDLDAVIESKVFANREKDRAVLPVLLETLRLQKMKG